MPQDEAYIRLAPACQFVGVFNWQQSQVEAHDHVQKPDCCVGFCNGQQLSF